MPRGRPSRRRVAVRRHAPSFFKRDAPPVEETPERPDAGADAARLQLFLKFDEFTGVIDAILAADKDRPKKQRHTSKRIFERLCDEQGFTGKITIVKDYVASWRQRTQEMFVPLVHPPGHAQADFGEAIGVIGGVEGVSFDIG